MTFACVKLTLNYSAQFVIYGIYYFETFLSPSLIIFLFNYVF